MSSDWETGRPTFGWQALRRGLKGPAGGSTEAMLGPNERREGKSCRRQRYVGVNFTQTTHTLHLPPSDILTLASHNVT